MDERFYEKLYLTEAEMINTEEVIKRADTHITTVRIHICVQTKNDRRVE